MACGSLKPGGIFQMLWCAWHMCLAHTPLWPRIRRVYPWSMITSSRAQLDLDQAPSPWWKPDMQSALTPKALVGLSGRQFNLMKHTQSHANGESFSKGFLQPCVGFVYSFEMMTVKTYIFEVPNIRCRLFFKEAMVKRIIPVSLIITASCPSGIPYFLSPACWVNKAKSIDLMAFY